jgi:hypothetical protein
MKLILTTDVPGLGAPGDIVEVRDGYGRNFLLPQGKAIPSTKGAEKQVATIKRAQLAREIRGTEHANEVKQALEKTAVVITARTTASNVWGEGSRWDYRLTPVPDGTLVGVRLERHGRNLKGKLIGALLPVLGAKVVTDSLRSALRLP